MGTISNPYDCRWLNVAIQAHRTNGCISAMLYSKGTPIRRAKLRWKRNKFLALARCAGGAISRGVKAGVKRILDSKTDTLRRFFAVWIRFLDSAVRHVGSLASGLRRMSDCFSSEEVILWRKLTECESDVGGGFRNDPHGIQGIRIRHNAVPRDHTIGWFEANQAHVRRG